MKSLFIGNKELIVPDHVQDVWKEKGGLWFCDYVNGWKSGNDGGQDCVHYDAEETKAKLMACMKKAMPCSCPLCKG